MLDRLRRARLLWPTVAALAALAVLVGLGTWQLDRKRWKEDLLAKIAAGAKAEPVVLFQRGIVSIKDLTEQLRLPADIKDAVEAGDVIVLETLESKEFLKFPEYRHVVARGRFLHDKEQYLYAPTPAGLGWHVYTPLQVAPGRVVWINRGFVPDARKAPATRPEGQVAGEVEVKGLVRFPAGKGVFTPVNDVQNNLWYWPDIAAMTAAAFPDGPQNAPGGPRRPEALPLVIEADAEPEPPGGLPRGGVTRLQLPNRHLEYAVTWYGLALTLIGVYLAFALSRWRAAGRA
jgi:surfeit locus 1 family protein